MALINTKIKPFNADAFKNGEFIKVSDADIENKWAIFFFYPADFTFVCPTELGDLADDLGRTGHRTGVSRTSVLPLSMSRSWARVIPT